MTADEKLDLTARAICRERCAFMGELPCFDMTEDDEAGTPLPWPNPHCDEPGCHAEASAALDAIRAAGWLLIPPLDTQEGQEAVIVSLRAWYSQFVIGDGEYVDFTRAGKSAMTAALRAAGGSK